jgi:hypothetical protein
VSRSVADKTSARSASVGACSFNCLNKRVALLNSISSMWSRAHLNVSHQRVAAASAIVASRSSRAASRSASRAFVAMSRSICARAIRTAAVTPAAMSAPAPPKPGDLKKSSHHCHVFSPGAGALMIATAEPAAPTPMRPRAASAIQSQRRD